MARSKLQAWADGIAEAIRIMREYPAGTKIEAPKFREEILAIKTGIDTNDGTAAAGDILSGKVAYSKEQRLVGTIPSGTTSQLSVSANRVTTAGGYYYPSSVYKDIPKVSLATPTITVNDLTGLITAMESQTSGYVDSATTMKTYQMRTLGSTTFPPQSYDSLIATPGTFVTGYLYVGAFPQSTMYTVNIVNNSSYGLYVSYMTTNGAWVSNAIINSGAQISYMAMAYSTVLIAPTNSSGVGRCSISSVSGGTPIAYQSLYLYPTMAVWLSEAALNTSRIVTIWIVNS